MVTFGETVQLGVNVFRVSWTSSLGSPPANGYRIFKNGVQVGTTTIEQMDVTLQPGESLVVEVLDDPLQSPATAFPSRFTLGWRPVPATASYRVEEYVGGVWTSRKVITEDGVTAFYRWESRALEDDTTFQFRVIPVGTNGNDGTSLSFTCLMVRYPDPPIADKDLDTKYVYSQGTNKVTINA